MAGHRGWLRGYLRPRRGAAVAAFAQGAAAYLEGSFSSGEHDAVVQFDSIGIPYMDMGIELSASSRGVLAWAVPRELGRAGVINPHTQLADVNALVDHVITIGDELTGIQSG